MNMPQVATMLSEIASSLSDVKATTTATKRAIDNPREKARSTGSVLNAFGMRPFGESGTVAILGSGIDQSPSIPTTSGRIAETYSVAESTGGAMAAPPQPAAEESKPRGRGGRRRRAGKRSKADAGYSDPLMEMARQERLAAEKAGRDHDLRRAGNKEWVKAMLPESYETANAPAAQLDDAEWEKFSPNLASERATKALSGPPGRPSLAGRAVGGARGGLQKIGGKVLSPLVKMMGGGAGGVAGGAGAGAAAAGAGAAAGGAGAAGAGGAAAGAAAGGAAAGAGGGIAAATVAALSNPVTAVVVGLTAVAAVTALAIKGIEKFAESTVEAYRGLEKFNGRLAVMFAQLDRQQVVMGARYAAATGGSANFAGKGLMGLREQMQPLSQAFGTLKNVAAGGLTRVAEGLVRVLNVVLKPIVWIAQALEKIVGGDEAAQPAPIAQLFGILGAGQLAGQQKPKNRRPGKLDH